MAAIDNTTGQLLDSREVSSRIRKACEECRKRKIKCDGHEPCRGCTERHCPCIFGQARRRRMTPLAHNSRPQSSGKLFRPFHVTHAISSPLEVISEAFFGPSSNFSLLFDLYRQLYGQDASDEDETAMANNCMDVFGYRHLIFTYAYSDPTQSATSLKISPHLALLPVELARLFLRNYTSTLLYVLPLQDADCLEQWLDEVYNLSPSRTSSSVQHSILFAVLAIGTTFTEHDLWGERLSQQAQVLANLTPQIMHTVPAIQTTLLLICSPLSP